MTITTKTTIAFRIPEDGALHDNFIKVNDISKWQIINGSNAVIYQRDNTVDMRMINPVRKGHWISIHPLQDNDSGAYMCSVCNTGDWDIKPTDKYCKFCGAKMGDE